jgi:sugar lactone lactonase YvrE
MTYYNFLRDTPVNDTSFPSLRFDLTEDLVSFYNLDTSDTTAAGGVVDQQGSNDGTATGFTLYNGTISGAAYSTDVPSGKTGGSLDFDGADDYVDTWSRITSSLVVSDKENATNGISFKTDGTEMYVIGTSSDSVHQYTLSSAWNISSATFTRSFSVNAQETNPREVQFSSDGTKMFILGTTGGDVTYYNLSTAWDISSASHVSQFSVAAKEPAPQGLYFKPDGTEMYVVGATEPDNVHQYTLSTPWDLSGTVNFTRSFEINASVDTALGLTFSSDGTKMFTIDSNGDKIALFTLSTPWDISSATTDTSYVMRFGYLETTPAGIAFNNDGTKLYFLGTGASTVFQINLDSAYSFTSSLFSNGFTLSAWIKPRSVGETSGRIMDFSYGTASNTGFAWYVDSSNRVGLGVNNVVRVSATNSVMLDGSAWYHVLVTVSNTGNVTHYVNGVASGTPGATSALTYMTNIGPIRIGNRTYATDRSFDGLIDDVRFYNRELSSTEVASIFNGADVGLNLFFRHNFDEGSGTNALDTKYLIKGPNSDFPVAWNFNGSSEYITTGPAPSMATASALTCGAWVRAETNPATSTRYLDYQRTSTNQKGFIMGVSTTRQLRNYIYVGGGYQTLLSTGTPLSDGLWHRVIMTYGGAVWRLYVDGVLNKELAQTGSIEYSGDENLFIGRRASLASEYHQGGVCGEFIVHRAWTPEEILNDYNDGGLAANSYGALDTDTHRIDLDDGQSMVWRCKYNDGTVSRARVFFNQDAGRTNFFTGTAVTMEVSANAGANWTTVTNNEWATLGVPGSDVYFRVTGTVDGQYWKTADSSGYEAPFSVSFR